MSLAKSIVARRLGLRLGPTVIVVHPSPPRRKPRAGPPTAPPPSSAVLPLLASGAGIPAGSPLAPRLETAQPATSRAPAEDQPKTSRTPAGDQPAGQPKTSSSPRWRGACQAICATTGRRCRLPEHPISEPHRSERGAFTSTVAPGSRSPHREELDRLALARSDTPTFEAP